MKRAALVLVPLLLACDREPVAPDSKAAPSLGAATSEWIPWDIEFPPEGLDFGVGHFVVDLVETDVAQVFDEQFLGDGKAGALIGIFPFTQVHRDDDGLISGAIHAFDKSARHSAILSRGHEDPRTSHHRCLGASWGASGVSCVMGRLMQLQ